MATSTQRDLFDWITGFGSMQQRMQARLARPVPDRRTAGARLSSAKLGWRNLGFEQLELAEGARVPAGRPGCHLVLLGLGSGTLVGPMPEGRALQVKPGSVLVLPAGEADAWKAQTALHCCLIYLDVRMLAQVAKSAYGASERDFEILALPIDYDFGVIGLAGVLAEEALRGIKGNNLYVNTLATHLAVHLLRHYASWRRKGPVEERRTAHQRALQAPEPVQRAVVHIRENHTRDVGVQEIADAAGENAFVLQRLFYETLGTEPGQYVLQLRMQSAESLLAAGAKSLPEVAQAVGFGDPAGLPDGPDAQPGGANPGPKRKQGVTA